MKKLLFTIIGTMVLLADINGQTLNTFVTQNITFQSAEASFYFHPNCSSGATYNVEYSTNAGFSPFVNAGGGSVTNVGYTRVATLSPLSPSTVYYWRVRVQLGSGCSSTPVISATQSFTTAAAPAASLPAISNISSSVNTNSASVSYSINANYGATTSLINYGLTSANLSNQVLGASANGGTLTPGNTAITSLQPQTVYYYQIEATNSAGTTTSSVMSFTTNAVIVAQTIAEYDFDNTYNNVLGSNPFLSNSGTSFVADRSGNPNSALNIYNTGSSATIPGLPYGNSPRTVLMWAKLNEFNSANNNYNMLYTYGYPSTSNSQGGSIRANGLDYLGYNDNLFSSVAMTNSINVWYFVAFTYDGTTAISYKNGSQVASTTKPWNTVNNSDIFKLGVGVGGELWYHGAIDDLKIMNYVLTPTQVDSVYNATSVVTNVKNITNLNSNFNILPNPATSKFTLDNVIVGSNLNIIDVTGKVVYTKTLNDVNEVIETTNLSNGIYIVQLNNKGAIAHKKLIIRK